MVNWIFSRRKFIASLGAAMGLSACDHSDSGFWKSPNSDNVGWRRSQAASLKTFLQGRTEASNIEFVNFKLRLHTWIEDSPRFRNLMRIGGACTRIGIPNGIGEVLFNSGEYIAEPAEIAATRLFKICHDTVRLADAHLNNVQFVFFGGADGYCLNDCERVGHYGGEFGRAVTIQGILNGQPYRKKINVGQVISNGDLAMLRAVYFVETYLSWLGRSAEKFRQNIGIYGQTYARSEADAHRFRHSRVTMQMSL